MKILITGNQNQGLAKELFNIYPEATFVSRESGYDLNDKINQENVAELALNYDIFINNSALSKFDQTNLMYHVFKRAKEEQHNLYIINIGSTVDRYNKGTDWLYSAEKKALRFFSDSLSKMSVWQNAPRVTLISFGSLSNVQEKHPDRVCINIDEAARYVEWLVNTPTHLHVNEISIDPLQIKNNE